MKYDYYYIENLISKNEIKEINDLVKNYNGESLSDLPAEGVLKTAEVSVIPMFYLNQLIYKFNQQIININRLYFGFDLFDNCDLEFANYNIYNSESSGQYSWHIDGCKGEVNDIKLTAILNLSENKFTGGEFDLFVNGPIRIPQIDNPGAMLVFPSFIPHRVNPVTTGQRITLSRWVIGPTWK